MWDKLIHRFQDLYRGGVTVVFHQEGQNGVTLRGATESGTLKGLTNLMGGSHGTRLYLK
jgi:hypothetical protein